MFAVGTMCAVEQQTFLRSCLNCMLKGEWEGNKIYKPRKGGTAMRICAFQKERGCQIFGNFFANNKRIPLAT